MLQYGRHFPWIIKRTNKMVRCNNLCVKLGKENNLKWTRRRLDVIYIYWRISISSLFNHRFIWSNPRFIWLSFDHFRIEAPPFFCWDTGLYYLSCITLLRCHLKPQLYPLVWCLVHARTHIYFKNLFYIRVGIIGFLLHCLSPEANGFTNNYNIYIYNSCVTI